LRPGEFQDTGSAQDFDESESNKAECDYRPQPGSETCIPDLVQRATERARFPGTAFDCSANKDRSPGAEDDPSGE
jgi:hypothetical protein